MTAEPAPTPDDIRSLYRERAHLVAFLASHYHSVIGYNDPDEPEWPVIYVSTPEGQLSWHLSKDDLDLFDHVPQEQACMTWDGHSTQEKYARLYRLAHAR